VPKPAPTLLRVLSRGDRYHVWRHGADHVEAVLDGRWDLRQYVEERRAIEGDADAIIRGVPMRLPREDSTPARD
jgi:hypothetical protein